MARRALDEGACIVNDVSGLRFDPAPGRPRGAAPAPRSSSCTCRASRARCRPRRPTTTCTEEVARFAATSAAAEAERRGLPRDRILVDPGIGFGKTAGPQPRAHPLDPAPGRPRSAVLIGASRKSFLGKILDLPGRGAARGVPGRARRGRPRRRPRGAHARRPRHRARRAAGRRVAGLDRRSNLSGSRETARPHCPSPPRAPSAIIAPRVSRSACARTAEARQGGTGWTSPGCDDSNSPGSAWPSTSSTSSWSPSSSTTSSCWCAGTRAAQMFFGLVTILL